MPAFFLTVARVMYFKKGTQHTIRQDKIRGDMVIASRPWRKGKQDEWVEGPMSEVTIRSDADSSSFNILIAEGCNEFQKRKDDARNATEHTAAEQSR